MHGVMRTKFTIQTIDDLLYSLQFDGRRVTSVARPSYGTYEDEIYYQLVAPGEHGETIITGILAEPFAMAVVRGWVTQCSDHEDTWKITQRGRDYLDAQRVARELEVA